MIARPVSGSPRKVALEAILKSQLKANSNPPPNAGPSMQAITG